METILEAIENNNLLNNLQWKCEVCTNLLHFISLEYELVKVIMEWYHLTPFYE